MSREWTPSDTYRPLYQPDQPLRPYRGELLPLTEADLIYFRDRFELFPSDVLGKIYLTGDSRYALPFASPTGERRGYVLRRPWEGSPPYELGCRHIKADTYRELVGPVQGHYGVHPHRGPASTQLVVVEDQLSAIKLAAYGWNSVALLGTPTDKLGTYGGQDRVAEVVKRSRGADEVIVALDADATDAAFMFVRKWGSAFKRIRVAILDRDVKDTPAKDFAEVLGVSV